MADPDPPNSDLIFQGRIQGRNQHQIIQRAKNLVTRWGYPLEAITIPTPCVHPVAPNGDAMVRSRKLDGAPQEFEAVVRIFALKGTIPTPAHDSEEVD